MCVTVTPSSGAATLVEADLGPIDVWVNNAGGVFPGAVAGLVDLDREAWDRIFELNLTAVLFGCQIAARRMTERAVGGSIVNISSFQGTKASPFMTPYGAAKAGLIQLSKSMALETCAGHPGQRRCAVVRAHPGGRNRDVGRAPGGVGAGDPAGARGQPRTSPVSCSHSRPILPRSQPVK